MCAAALVRYTGSSEHGTFVAAALASPGSWIIITKEVGTMEGSLYERLGGTDALTAVTLAFVERAGKDDRINQKFARTDLARLTKEFVDQLCGATGGPCTYTGRSMTQAHADMGVTNGEFDAFIEDLVAILDNFKVGKAEQGELLSLLSSFRGEIVEVNSTQVGTPLPSTFVPAPPLVS
jgi:hemoglobin